MQKTISANLELGLKAGDFADEVSERIGQRLLWAVVRGGLNPKNEFVLKWVGHLVSRKQHLGIVQ